MRNTERTLLFSSNAGNVTSCNLSEPLSSFERVCIKTSPNVEWETWVTADAGNHRLNTFGSYNNDGYMVWPTNFNITNGTKTITVNRFQLLMQQATNTGLNLFGWNNTAGNIKRIGAVWGVNRINPIETEGLGMPQGEGWKEYNETLLWSGTDYANQWVVNLSGRALEYERLKVGVGSHGESPNFIEVDAPTTYDSQLPLYSWWGTSTGSFWYDNHIYKWGNETRTISAISGKGWNLGTGAANPYTTTGLYNTTDTHVRRPLFAIWGINHKSPHKLTLLDSPNGTSESNRLTGYEYDVATISDTPNEGWYFDRIEATGATVNDKKIIFKDQDASAQVIFTDIEPIYNLTLQNDGHGTLAAGKTTGHSGDSTNLSTTANTYYQFNNYSVTGGTINGNTFTWNDSNATAKANFKLQTSANVYSNTTYNVTRTPASNATLSINATAPTAAYKIFALKWQEHWGGGGSLYEMGVHTISNNYDFWECLCSPVPKTACPLWHKSGRTTFPGNYSNCTFTAQSRYNDAWLYKKQSNASFYTRKLIYNNNNNTISGYLNNTFMFQVTGVGTFTSMNSFTYGGNKSYPATAYVKDIRLYAFANASDAISW